MAMEGLSEVVPPFGRVPGQLLLAPPILKWRRRRYREEFGNKRSILGVSSARAKYRRKRAPRGATRDPEGSLARIPPWPRHQGAWAPGGGPLVPLWIFGKLRER